MSALVPIIETLLSLVSGFLPKIASLGSAAVSPVVDEIIQALENIIPALTSEFPSIVASVQGMIASLTNGSTPLTASQLTTLVNMSAQLDAKFNADAVAADDDATAAAPSASS